MIQDLTFGHIPPQKLLFKYPGDFRQCRHPNTLQLAMLNRSGCQQFPSSAWLASSTSQLVQEKNCWGWRRVRQSLTSTVYTGLQSQLSCVCVCFVCFCCCCCFFNQKGKIKRTRNSTPSFYIFPLKAWMWLEHTSFSSRPSNRANYKQQRIPRNLFHSAKVLRIFLVMDSFG